MVDSVRINGKIINNVSYSDLRDLIVDTQRVWICKIYRWNNREVWSKQRVNLQKTKTTIINKTLCTARGFQIQQQNKFLQRIQTFTSSKKWNYSDEIILRIEKVKTRIKQFFVDFLCRCFKFFIWNKIMDTNWNCNEKVTSFQSLVLRANAHDVLDSSCKKKYRNKPLKTAI